MKTIGIVRKLDELGRICLPKELRKTLDLGDRAEVEISVDGDKIILEKYEKNKKCCCCGEEHECMIDIDGESFLCSYCFNKFKERADVIRRYYTKTSN